MGVRAHWHARLTPPGEGSSEELKGSAPLPLLGQVGGPLGEVIERGENKQGVHARVKANR